MGGGGPCRRAERAAAEAGCGLCRSAGRGRGGGREESPAGGGGGPGMARSNRWPLRCGESNETAACRTRVVPSGVGPPIMVGNARETGLWWDALVPDRLPRFRRQAA
ncbi:hypothetical protein GCM10023220_10520 [Streptomyces ziwulingensis]|uniref:Uncharacterized protein n=1 Tax=Streptomyces ziwulingensis TaxID=1045501 RepID=A0ABP9AZY5_9ACTN